MLKKFGFPASLGAKTLPRCLVGSGKGARYYMWKDTAACNFLGGKMVKTKHSTCKVGKPHQWVKVTRCVQGPVLTNKGLNYKTGQAHYTKDKVTKITKIGGMVMGMCYKFQAYEHSKDYLKIKGIRAYNSPHSGDNVFKVVKGISGHTNSVSLIYKNKAALGMHGNGVWAKSLHSANKHYQSFYVTKGMAGKGVSFMSTKWKGWFIKHKDMKKGVAEHQISWLNAKKTVSVTYKKAATWYAKKV
jgi:hypothetical protein